MTNNEFNQFLLLVDGLPVNFVYNKYKYGVT